MNRFAHTFNGDDWAASLEELAERYRAQHRDWMSSSVLTDTGLGHRAP